MRHVCTHRRADIPFPGCYNHRMQLHSLLATAPLIAIIGLGFSLRRAGMMHETHARGLLKLVFYVGMPVVIFRSITTVELSPSLWIFALVPFVIIAAMLVLVYASRRLFFKDISSKMFGSLLAGVAIMNTGFLLPFVQQMYGDNGVARLVILDTVNAVLTFTVVYFFATHAGTGKLDGALVRRKMLYSPPIWAILVALSVRISGLVLPQWALESLGLLSQLVGPIILLALGALLTLRVRNLPVLMGGLAMRFGGGLLVGLLIVWLFDLQKLDAAIVLLGTCAPAGFNSITIAELEELDSTFVASLVSVALLIALVTIPLSISLLPV